MKTNLSEKSLLADLKRGPPRLLQLLGKPKKKHEFFQLQLTNENRKRHLIKHKH